MHYIIINKEENKNNFVKYAEPSEQCQKNMTQACGHQQGQHHSPAHTKKTINLWKPGIYRKETPTQGEKESCIILLIFAFCFLPNKVHLKFKINS